MAKVSRARGLFCGERWAQEANVLRSFRAERVRNGKGLGHCLAGRRVVSLRPWNAMNAAGHISPPSPGPRDRSMHYLNLSSKFGISLKFRACGVQWNDVFKQTVVGGCGRGMW